MYIHHNCNNGGDELEPMLAEIFSTWEGQPLPPKVHFSSPKTGEKDKNMLITLIQQLSSSSLKNVFL